MFLLYIITNYITTNVIYRRCADGRLYMHIYISYTCAYMNMYIVIVIVIAKVIVIAIVISGEQ